MVNTKKPKATSKSNPKTVNPHLKDNRTKPKKPPKRPHFFGIHAVQALLNHRPQDALGLFVQNGDRSDDIDNIVKNAQHLGISIQYINKDKLTELCQSSQHQGIAVLSRLPSLANEALLEQLSTQADVVFLILDQITDAHNFGACLRSACAMGVAAVIIPKNQSATITPTVAKVSVGASEVVPVVAVTNLARAIEYLKSQGVFVFGTALDSSAKKSYECDFGGKIAIVMGSEGNGMRRLTTDLCDTLCFIDMDNSGVQSLNVSVATGIMLYEVKRQRALR